MRNVHFAHHCCSAPLPLDATGLENGCPATKELICSAFGVQRVDEGYAMCVSLTTEHRTISACRLLSVALEASPKTVYSRLRHKGRTTTLGFAN